MFEAHMSWFRSTSYLVLGLQTIDNGCEFTEGLVSLLVVLKLGGNKLRQIAKGLRGVQNLVIERTIRCV